MWWKKTMQALFTFARDFAAGVHAGHGIRYGVTGVAGHPGDRDYGDDRAERAMLYRPAA